MIGPADWSSPASATGWPISNTMPAAAAPVAGAELVDHLAGPVDLARERVAGRAVARAPSTVLGARDLLLADLDLDGVAEWLDLGEPLARGPAERCDRGRRLAAP